MDNEDWVALAAQQALIGLSDNPRQFHEPPLVGIFRHAARARPRDSDQMSYMTMPF